MRNSKIFVNSLKKQLRKLAIKIKQLISNFKANLFIQLIVNPFNKA